jgi:hypothetical protein
MRSLTICAATVLIVLLSLGGPVFGRGGRGGGIGGGGGFGGGRSGGGGIGGGFRGGNVGGGGSVFRGGGLSGNVRRSPGTGGTRSSGFNLESSLGRSPGINLGSSATRSPGINLGRQGTTTLGRQGTTALRPNVSPGIGIAGSGILGNRTFGNGAIGNGNILGGQSQAGSRLGGLLGSAANRAANGQGILNLNPGNLGSGIVGRGTANAGTSAGDVGRFLSLGGRQPGANLGSLSRAAQASTATNLARGTGTLRLNSAQANLVRGNVHTAFNRSLSGANLNNRAVLGAAALSPAPALHWNNWAGGIRHGWNPIRYHGHFNNRFWATHHVHFPWRRSYYWWGGRPWGVWWGRPTWNNCVTWFPSWGWSSPYYYDYGPGGNVVFSSGYVYVNGQPVATVDDYASSAYDLATVPQPANPDEATEWLPLGTFALSAGEDDKDPSRVLQLAVDRDGNISGTMYNETTGQTYAVQGRVDKATQRVAFTIGENTGVVFETGIYNLTQEQTPLLAQGEGRTETYLLLRLDPPKADDSAVPSTGDSKTLVP